nr:hypothetical protein MarFTME_231 [Marseillevirus futianmevirus]
MNGFSEMLLEELEKFRLCFIFAERTPLTG